MQEAVEQSEFNNDGSVSVTASVVYNGAPQAVNVRILCVTRHARHAFRLRDRQNIIDRYYNGAIYAGAFWNTPDWKMDECFATDFTGPYYEWDAFLAMLMNRHW